MEVDVSGLCCRVYIIDKSTLYFLRSPVVFSRNTQGETAWYILREKKKIKKNKNVAILLF